jgi:hypothetical protein
MKTKGRLCKKAQQARILLRTLQIARSRGTKRFRGMVIPLPPCFGENRLYVIENIAVVFAAEWQRQPMTVDRCRLIEAVAGWRWPGMREA